jgi:hypothetical protein
MKSVKPKDKSGEPPAHGGGRNAEADLRIPGIVTADSDGSRPFVPIDRDQCEGAVRCIF